jgi:hypothetical protein
MTGGYYDPERPPQFRGIPGIAPKAATLLNDNVVPPGKTFERRDPAANGTTHVLRVTNLGDGIFVMSAYHVTADGRIVDQSNMIFRRHGNELTMAIVEREDGRMVELRSREAAKCAAPGGVVETRINWLLERRAEVPQPAVSR